MLVVSGLSKHFIRSGKPHVLFHDLSFHLNRSDRLALFGRNGQGKSTLIKILGGVLAPSQGQVHWDATSSWPLGFGGAFQGGLTGIDNIRFIARIYDRPQQSMIERVERFAELGDALTIAVKHYSSGMRARLAFGLTLAIEFDCYLIDEVISVGDASFRLKCEEELFVKRSDRAFVIASHDLVFLRQTCNCALVIDRGTARFYRDVNEGAEIYNHICAGE